MEDAEEIKNAANSYLVCMRIEDGPNMIGTTMRCKYCEAVCAISAETAKLFACMPEPRVMVCTKCFAQGKIGNLNEIADIVEAPTAGQLLEIIEYRLQMQAREQSQ